MSKKFARKGIALATGLAFSITGLTALPATAADGDGVLAWIEPNSGTSMIGTLDYKFFDLNVEIDAGSAYQGYQMLRIDNPTGADIVLSDNGDFYAGWDVYVKSGSNLVSADAVEWNVEEDEYTYDDTVLYIDLSSNSYSDNDDYAEVYIGTAEESGTVELTLTNWSDRNFDGVMGPLEKANGSATEKLTFVDASKITPIVSLLQSYDGDLIDGSDTSIETSTKFSPAVNVDYMNTGDWYVTLYEGTVNRDLESYDNVTIGSANVEIMDYQGTDSNDNAIEHEIDLWYEDEFDFDTFGTGKFQARAVYDTGDGSDPYEFRGSRSNIVELYDDGEFANLAITADDANVIVYENDIDVRSGTKALTFTVEATDEFDDLVSSLPIVVRVDNYDTEGNLGTETIGLTGRSYVSVEDGADQGVDVSGKTNSKGEFTFTVNVSDALDGSDFDLQIGSYLGSGDIDWSEDLNYSVYFVDAFADEVTSNKSVFAGANPAITYEVIDQFGEPTSVDSEGQKLKIEITDDSDSDLLKKSGDVVNGAVTISFANYLDVGETSTISAVLYTGLSSTNSLDVSIDSVALYNPAASGSIDSAAEVEGFITYDDFIVGKLSTLQEADDTVEAPASEDSELIEGSVQDVDGRDLPAAVVTITGKGLQFEDTEEAGTYTVNSITVIADENGYFGVNVWSHEVSEDGIKVTIASGGKSATVKFITDWTTPDADQLMISWNIPAHPAVGKTYVVTSSLTDKWGNAIPSGKIEFTTDGVLEVNGRDSTVKSVNASGKASVFIRGYRQLEGFGGLTAIVTEADVNGSTAGGVVALGGGEELLSKELFVGMDGNATAGKNKGVLRVAAWNAAGNTVVVKVGNKVVATRTANSNAFKFRLTGIKSGDKDVTVRVDGNTYFKAPVTIK